MKTTSHIIFSSQVGVGGQSWECGLFRNGDIISVTDECLSDTQSATDVSVKAGISFIQINTISTEDEYSVEISLRRDGVDCEKDPQGAKTILWIGQSLTADPDSDPANEVYAKRDNLIELLSEQFPDRVNCG